jgi:hypothetical protein
MHPLISQTVAAEHVRDMRIAAVAARRARLTRRTRPDSPVPANGTKRTPSSLLRTLGA